MRRFGAAMVAVLLVLSLGSAAAGAASKSWFNGDFDALVNGEVVGHITVQTNSSPGGTWSFAGTSGSGGTGVIGQADFYQNDGYNEVWFKALEVGYPTPTYGIFIAHVIDYLDPAATDTIEFWSAPVDWDFTAFPETGGSIGSAWNGMMDVGPGAFVLKVRGS